MIKANIYTKTVGKKILWKLEVIATIKNQEHKKEIEGIITSKEDLAEPINTLIASLKKPDIEIELVSNASFIIKEASKYSNIKAKKEEITTSFKEVEEYAEENLPDLPDYLNVRLSDIQNENDFLRNLEISMVFVKAYLFFNENPEKVTDIPLYKDLKEDILMEDILAIVEDYLSKA